MRESYDQHSYHQVQASVGQEANPALNLCRGTVRHVSCCTGTDKCVVANHLNLITVSLWQATENQSQKKRVCRVLRVSDLQRCYQDYSTGSRKEGGESWKI